jgi:hypothetical protein
LIVSTAVSRNIILSRRGRSDFQGGLKMENSVSISSAAKQDEFVGITVTDAGIGMDNETMEAQLQV